MARRINHLNRTMTMRLSERMLKARESRRVTSTGGGVIRASAPEGPRGALRPRCGAVAGMSSHGPMT